MLDINDINLVDKRFSSTNEFPADRAWGRIKKELLEGRKTPDNSAILEIALALRDLAVGETFIGGRDFTNRIDAAIAQLQQ